MLALVAGGIVSLVHAAVRRRAAPFLVAATFAPLAITAWLNLDVYAASRYAIGYLAMYAVLAADGFLVIGRNRVVQTALCAAVIVVAAIWTWPALRTQRTTDPPPSAALSWVVRNVPASEPVFVSFGLEPHATYFLPGRKVVYWKEEREIPLDTDVWIVDFHVANGAHNFVYPHHSIWKILRRRNFEVSVNRSAGLIRFGEGWYSEEGTGFDTWRWMPLEARAQLPHLRGRGRLSMTIRVPLDELPHPPTVSVYLNGRLVEAIERAPEVIQRAWVLESRADGPNELRIVTTATVNLARLGKALDDRDLGLRIEKLAWTPAR
jgi:hypothetical protein